jgi:hypothetical protein
MSKTGSIGLNIRNYLVRIRTNNAKSLEAERLRLGPISSLSVFGKTIIILNDAQLAVQLLEKRSVIHSLRPQQIFTDM